MPTYYIPIPESKDEEVKLDMLLNGLAARFDLEQKVAIMVECSDELLHPLLDQIALHVCQTPLEAVAEKPEPERPVKIKSSRSEKREEGLRLLREGELSQAEIAKLVGVSETSVSGWKKKMAEQEEQREPASNGGAHHVTVVSRDGSTNQIFSPIRRGAIKGHRLG